jgi:hypothetical protein
MYSLLLEELAREREQALLRDAGSLMLAARARAAGRRPQAAAGPVRRSIGRLLMGAGARVARTTVPDGKLLRDAPAH